MELYADATGCRTMVSAAPDAVLLGTAMCAAAAAGLHPSLATASAAMSQGVIARDPDPQAAARYARDWQARLLLLRHRAEIDALEGGSTAIR